MTTTRPNYTPAYREDGSRLTIRGMAASSIARQSYQVSTCDNCRAYVAWAKSSKTGKWYVCETAEYTSDEGNHKFRAVPYKFHQCREVGSTATGPIRWDEDANYEGYGRADEQVKAQEDNDRFMAALRRQADGTANPTDDATVAEFHARMVR